MFFSRTEQFQLINLFPIAKDSLDLSITNRFVYLRRTARLVRHLAASSLQDRSTVVPGNGTLVFESITSFIQGMTEDQLGKEKASGFVPLVLTVFLLILGRNRMGMIPQTFPFILATCVYLRVSKRGNRFPGFSVKVGPTLGAAATSRRARSGSYGAHRKGRFLQRYKRLAWRELQVVSLFGGNRSSHGGATAWIQSTTELPTAAKVTAGAYEGFLAKVAPAGDASLASKRRSHRSTRATWRTRGYQRAIFVGALRLFSTAPSSFTPTSHLAFTFRISRSLFLGLIFYSLERHGLHFFSFFYPRGIPFALAPFIVVLEMISFFFRPVSLGVRLRANMTAGHLLLHTVRGFVSTLLGSKGIAFCLIGRRGGRVLEGVFLLETGVCFLQAYVFTALFTIYLKDAEALH